MPAFSKEDFNLFYRSIGEKWGRPPGRPPITLHYHWFPIIRHQRSLAFRVRDILGLNSGDTVLLVGCGFNGTGAGLMDLGINVIGTEVSGYIDNEKGNTEEAELRAAIEAAGLNPDTDQIIGPPGNVMVNPLDLLMEGGRAAPATRGKGEILIDDLSVRGSRNSIQNEFERIYGANSTPRYIITEEVLNSVTDNEAGLVAEHARDFAAENGGGTVVHMLSPRQSDSPQVSGLNWKTYAEWRALLDANGFGAQQIIPTVSAFDQGMTVPADNRTANKVNAYGGLI